MKIALIATVSNATVSTALMQGDVSLDMYLMTGVGALFHDDERMDIDFFDVALNIVLSNYNFCDDCPPLTNRNMDFLEPLQEGATDVATDEGQNGRGEYIDVAFSVSGRTLRETGTVSKILSDRLEFCLGGSITLVLSRKVNIDGTWMNMPDGFPAIDRLEDGVPIFVARFPRFTDTAYYNPLLTTSREGLPTFAPHFETSWAMVSTEDTEGAVPDDETTSGEETFSGEDTSSGEETSSTVTGLDGETPANEGSAGTDEETIPERLSNSPVDGETPSGESSSGTDPEALVDGETGEGSQGTLSDQAMNPDAQSSGSGLEGETPAGEEPSDTRWGSIFW